MYCQLHINREKEPQIEVLANTIGLLLSQIPLQNMDCVVENLKNAWYEVKILKKSRPESKAGERDAYILWIQVGENIIAIKIHPDTFRVCRKIYKKSPLLEQLVHDGDTSQIYATGVSEGMRFVLYRWDTSPTLQDVIQSRDLPLEKIRHGMSKRVQSLTQKWIFIRASTPGDWIVRPEGDVRLLDLNKAHSTRRSSRDMTQITLKNNGVWLQELLTGARP